MIKDAERRRQYAALLMALDKAQRHTSQGQLTLIGLDLDTAQSVAQWLMDNEKRSEQQESEA